MLQTAQGGAHGASRRSTAISLTALGLLVFGLNSPARAQDLDDAACMECHATDQTETDGKELKAATASRAQGEKRTARVQFQRT